MELSDRKIIHLPVFTKSGKELGKVSGFEIDTNTQAIKRYYVKSHRLVAELFSKELIIGATQVISITDQKMTVEDLDLKEQAEDFEKERLIKDKVAPPISFSKCK